MIVIACILLILIFTAGMSFASADVDDLQANENLTDESEVISVSSEIDESNDLMIDENEDSREVLGTSSDNEKIDEVLSASSDNDVLKVSEVYISPTGTSSGDGSRDSPYDWNTAYSKVDAGGTIYFLNGTYNNIRDKEIKKSLILVGIGDAVIDAKGSNLRIFKLYNAAVKNFEAHNLVFANAGKTGVTSGFDGGAIDMEFTATVTTTFLFKNCTFKNNRAAYGAAFCPEMTGPVIINVTDCLFINNSAPNYGGTVCICGKGAYSKIYFKNNKFIDCHCTSKYGGAIYVSVSKNAEKTFENLTFINCSAATNGGAFYSDDVNDLVFKDCNFINVHCNNGFGGAIAIEGLATNFKFINSNVFNSSASTKGSAIYLKTANGVTVKNVHIENYSGLASNNGELTGDGGVIWIGANSGSFEMDTVTFKNNKVFTNRGHGGIIYCNSFTNASCNVTLNNVNFSDIMIKTGSKYGGGMYIGAISCNASFSNMNFNNISLTGSSSRGGALYIASASKKVTFTNVTFNNTNCKEFGGAICIGGAVSTGITFDNVNFTNVKTESNGGAIHITGTATNFKLVNSNIFNSSTKTSGSAIYLTTANGVTLNKVRIENYSATSSGAAIYMGSSGNLNMTKVSFKNNVKLQTSGNGGIVYCGGADKVNLYDVNFTDSYITSNTPIGGAMYIASLSDANFTKVKFVNNTLSKANGKGGALYLKPTGQVSFKDTSFTNITLLSSNSYGAAIFIGNSDVTATPITLTNLKFDNVNFTNVHGDSSDNTGGAIYIRATTNSFSINNSNFINVSCSKNGGAIYNEASGSFSVVNSTFKNINSSYGIIHIVKTISSGVMFNNDTFINVKAIDGSGAAIYFQETGSKNIQVLNSKFDNYQVKDDGGAIYFNQINIAKIENSTFTNGKAVIGGALYINGESVSIINSKFINHTVEEQGGAIYWNGKNGKVLGSQFANNVAESVALGGGAIYVSSDSRYMNITKSNFTNNNATLGGALYIASNDAYISNCNFTKNNAWGYGGAIYFSEVQKSKLYNSQFDDNTATLDGGAIYLQGQSNEIHNSTFTNNRAKDGGAIYDINNQNTIINSTFKRNIADEDGGGLYLYMSNSDQYSDWDDFRGNAERNATSDRLTWYQNPSLRTYAYFLDCLFEDNIDYLLSVRAIDSGTTNGYIEINGPRTANKRSASDTKTMMTVVISNQSGVIYTYDIDLITAGNASLTTGFLPLGLYDVKVTFYDMDHLVKYNSTLLNITSQMGDFYYLQKLINESIERGDPVLQLNRSFTFTEGIDTSQVNITANYSFKIIGNGLITINALNHCRIFLVNSSNITIENIRFINGNASGDFNDSNFNGGAIHWVGSNGTLNNCEFRNNYAEYGGGLYFNSSAVNCSIDNCYFVNDHAVYNGGAIDCNATNMALTDTIFESNYGEYGSALCREANADGGHGFNNTFIGNHAYKSGPALGWMNSSSISINTYFFYNNTADVSGGAIYVGNGSGNCHIINCEFEGNRVLNETAGRGGAIDWFATEGLVLNSSFTDNHAFEGGAIYLASQANDININNTNFTRNAAVGNGGAIYLLASTATLNQTNFYDNTAKNGGALYVDGQGQTNQVYSSVFKGNKATDGNGGAIEWLASSGSIIDSNLTGNCANYGGGIYLGGLSEKSNISSCIFTDNHAKYAGGAIDCNSQEMYLTFTTFDGNYAQFGAALCREPNAKGGHGQDNVFKNNHAYISGAALGWMSSVNITIINYTFINNSADVRGGAIYVNSESHNCSIIDSVFENNYVTNKSKTGYFNWTAWDNTPMYFAVSDQYTDPAQINTTVRYNDRTIFYYDGVLPEDALGVGGAILVLAENATIRNSNFTESVARLGGAVYVGSDSGNTVIDKSIFSDNEAYERGGAINLDASAVSIDDSKFYDNRAVDGAALYVGGVGTENKVYGTVFKGNKASGYGAGIYWVAYAGEMDNINFTENKAMYGGGIYFNGKSGNTNLTNVIFKLNNATKNGGAIECNASNIGIYNITFDSNYAGEYGAALCREDGATNGHGKNNTFKNNHAGIAGAALAWMNVSNIFIDDYHFTDNTAYGSGAAIFADIKSDNCTVFNCTFEGNHLTNMSLNHNGGAIDCRASNFTVNMSSFTNNGAYNGGAIYIGSSSGDTKVILSNFTRNYATGNGGAISLKASAVTINQTNFIKNTADIDGGALYVGGNGTTNVINYAKFEDNQAGYHGGAINWLAEAGQIFYTNFLKNTATYGGALYLSGVSSNSTIFDSYFKENRATKNGGAIDCNATRMGLNNTQFISNYAGEYGAALCREANATGGFGQNNNFTGNHADIAGAALAWLGVDKININNYRFVNNTAGKSGGAIYVREDSPNCVVRNSYFESNHVTDVNVGQGGAIDWLGTNGTIYNSTFKNSFAVNGGALFVGNASNNMSIINSTFDHSRAIGEGGSILLLGGDAEIINSNFSNSIASKRGGAIAAHGAYNATIVDCAFTECRGAGDVDSADLSDGDGGAIYWENANNLNISNINISEVKSNAMGAVTAVNCNDSTIYNVTFKGILATSHGGSIAWINSTNLTVDLCNFYNTGASYNGGSIFLNNTNGVVKNSKFKETSTPWGNGGAIYVNGNVTMDNLTMSDFSASKDNAAAIYLHDGVSTISNSSFDGSNTIWVGKNANATIVKNNITGRNSNRDVMYLVDNYSAETNPVLYSVWNDGDMYLEGNDFAYVIFNNGTIGSKTYTYMLDNKTRNITWMDSFTFWAKILDDTQKNHIISVDTLIATNDVYQDVGTSYPMKYNRIHVQHAIYQGSFHLQPNDTSLKKNTPFNGTVNVKMPLNLTLEHGDLTQEKIVITAKLTPNSTSNFTLENKMVFVFRGNGEEVNISVDYKKVGNFSTWFIANATYELSHLAIGHYTVTAYYLEDHTHESAQGSVEFDINPRKTWINVFVNNVTWGYYPVANVTTNGNGTVLVSIKGRTEEFELKNEDGTYYNNNSVKYLMVDGALIIPFDTLYDPDVYFVSATYKGDDYYAYALNNTKFEIYHANTTISANATNISFWDVEIINVTLDINTTGFVKVTLNNTGVIQEYMTEIINGTGFAQFRIPNLFGGNYTNVEVRYMGDERFNSNVTYVNFTVKPSDDFNMTLDVENIEYGENATVRVYLPTLAYGTVTIFVDNGYNCTVDVVNGVAILNNISGLAGGTHFVNATYNGGSSYAAKNITDGQFNVTQKQNWNMNITVDAAQYGGDTNFTIRLPKEVSKNVTLEVDGINYTVELTDGVGYKTLNNLSGGFKTAIAYYEGDANYSEKSVEKSFILGQLAPYIIIIHGVENTTYVAGTSFTINVTTNSTEKINITLNGKVVNVTDKNINVSLGALEAGHYIVRAVVFENDNYTYAETAVEFTVVRLNATIVIEGVENTTYNVDESFNVKVITNSTGVLNLTIDGVVYPVVNDTVIPVGILAAGHHIITAVVYENENYTMAFRTVEFTVEKFNATVAINGVVNTTYMAGTAFTINATTNSSSLINITVNGKSYVVRSNENIPVSVLEAGHYIITAVVDENENYTSAIKTVEFTVKKYNATLVINGVENTTYMAGTAFTINATTNSSNLINITVNGRSYVVRSNENIPVSVFEAGHYIITAVVDENDNYTMATQTIEFTVIKYNATVVINGVENETYVAGTVFTINATTNSSSMINITVNGKLYTVKNNENIDLGALDVGHYIVTAVVDENDNYTMATQTIEFTVVKYNSTIAINGVENTTYMAGTEFTINATTNSTSLINITVNGKSYVVENNENIDLGALEAGHYIVTAFVKANHNYTFAVSSVEFTVEKYNATVAINGVENTTYMAGTEFTINATTNSSSLINISVNGKVYTVASGENIDLGALEAGHYIVTAVVDANHNYTMAAQTVEFTVIKYNATVVINGVGNKTYEAGTSFTINATTNSSSLINVTVNGKSYVVASGENIDLGALEAGHYIVTAFVKANHNYTFAVSSVEFTVEKYNATVEINGVENKTYEAGTSFTINATTNSTSLINITVNGKSYVVASGENIDLGALEAGHYIVTAFVKANHNYTMATQTVEFTVVKYNATVVINGVENKTYEAGTSFTINATTNSTSLINITVNGKLYTVASGENVDLGALEAGHYIVTAVVDANHNYTMAAQTVEFTVLKYNAAVDIIGIENITYNAGPDFEVVVTTNSSSLINVSLNGIVVDVVANGGSVNFGDLAEGHYIITATVSENHNYTMATKSIEFSVVRFNATVVINGVENKTYEAGTSFTINATTNSSSLINITVNGKSYVVANGENIDLGALEAGHYIVTAVVDANHNYTMATQTVEFTVIKYNAIVEINGVENKTYEAGTAFTINAATNSTSLINITVNGKSYVVASGENIDLGALEAGHYIVTAFVKANHNYTYAISSLEFTVEKYNATVAINGVENTTYMAGTEFTINATTNSSSLINITVNGKLYTVVSGENIGLGALEAGHYIVTAVVDANHNYTMATQTVEFTVVKYNATVEINGVENKTYEAGTSFTINATTNSSSLINITVNGKSYVVASGENINLGALEAGHYIVTAFVKANHNYTFAVSSVEFTVEKFNATVVINGVENKTYEAGTSFTINATTNSSSLINITVNGKLYTVASGENIDLGALEAGHYIVTAVVDANHNYTYAISSLEFTVEKYNATVVINGVENKTYEAGTSFTINATTNSSSLINITVNGKSYVVASGENIDLGALEAGHYIVTAVVDANHNYTMATQTIEFTVIKYNAIVEINGVENKTYEAGTSFTVNATTNSTSLINVTVNGKSYVVASGENIDLGALEAGHYIVTAFVKANHNYTFAISSVEFTVEKYNATVVIDGVENTTYMAGTEFIINATTNSSSLINITVNGKLYTVGNNENIDLGALEAGHYIVTAVVDANHNYTMATQTIEFTVIKYNATVVINGVENKTYEAGTSFTINATTNSTSLINITVNGKVYTVASGENIDLGALEAGHYIVTAVVDANHNYTMAAQTIEFTVLKYNAAVDIIGIENITYNAGPDFEVVVTTNSSSLINVSLNGIVVDVVANGGSVNFGDLAEGHYIITATVSENHNYTMATKSIEFSVVRFNAIVEINGVENKTYEAGTSFTVNATTNSTSLINVTVNGKSYVVASGENIDLGALEAGHYIVTAFVKANHNYTYAISSVEFTVEKYNATVVINGVENTTYLAGTEFIINATTNSTSLINITVNGKLYTVASGENIDLGALEAGHYIVTAVVDANDNYTMATQTVEFTVVKYNATVTINGVENKTYEAGTSFTINATTNSTSLINVTVNGKSYVVASGENIDLGALEAGHYIVTAFVKANHNYTYAISSVEFTVEKYNATVAINGVENTTYMAGTEFTINATTNSSSLINITVNGKLYTVGNNENIDLGALEAGHYIVTAVVDANHNYTMATQTIEFTVIKYNATVTINGVENKTYEAGTSFTVNATTNSTSLINVTVNGKSYVVASGENIDLGALEAGHYIVTAFVKANHNYTYAISSVEFTVEKYNATVVINGVENTTYMAGTEFTINATTNSTGLINITVNGKLYTVGNNENIDLGALEAGHYIVTAVVDANDNYTMATQTVEFTVVKYNATVVINGVENKTYEAGTSFTINATTNSTSLINVTVNGKSYVVANGENIDLGALEAGHYIVTAVVDANHNYTYAISSVEFTVEKYNATVVINGVENKTYEAGTSFTINATTNSTSLINITVNGKLYTVGNNENIDLGALEAGHYIVTAVVDANHNYTMATQTIEFTVIKYNATVAINGVENTTYYAGTLFTINATTNSTGLINITVNGKLYTVGNNENIDLGALEAGHYIVTAVVGANDNYTMATQTIEFTVAKNPASITINATDVKAGDAQVINVTVPGDAKGLVLLDVDGKHYYANITGGLAQFEVRVNKAGEYVAVATYMGDDIYLSNSTSTSFNVSKVDHEVEVEIEDAVAGGDMVVKVTLPEDANGTIAIKIDNETVVNVTAKGGENTIVISNMTEGTHNVSTTYSGDDKYESKTVNKTITVTTSVIAQDKLVRGLNSLYDYEAEFLDKQGKVLADTEVQFVINGKTYTAKTDEKGTAKLTSSHLGLGTYNVTSINPVTGQKVTKELTIVKRLVENKDITMDFYDGTKFKVKVIGDDGKPVGAGEFVRAYINNVYYPLETNKNGYASLNINLNPAKYTITLEYKGYKVKNTLKVKQTLKLVKKTVKVKKGKKFVLKAKLKWSNGKPIRGKKIVFKFKGKKYKVKTNNKGIAKVNIKKAVAKKLKKGKTYEYLATYKTNTVKGKVKVKK